jgi:transposase
MRVALEASGVSQWVADVIEELGHEVVVVDPFRTSAVAVAGGYKKTDALDAATLAWLSSKGAVVASYRPSAAARHLRRMLAIRSRLLRSRGDMVRTVRGLLAGEGIVLPRRRKYRGFSAAVRVIEGVDLSVYGALLETIDTLDHHIRVADARIIEEADKDSVARRLMTADGIGPISALAFRALIEDPHRFRAARQVASYIGLAPAVYNSARTKRLGHISRRGDKFVRATLVEAANSLLHRCRRPSTLRDWGLQLKARVGSKKAAVAVARKMATIMWSMWKNGTDFRRCSSASRSERGARAETSSRSAKRVEPDARNGHVASRPRAEELIGPLSSQLNVHRSQQHEGSKQSADR